MIILVVNTGSSSLKYQLYDTKTQVVTAKGLCERIGLDGRIKHSPADKAAYEADVEMKNHLDAIKVVIDLLTSADYGVIKNISEIDAVGHRVVHGAEEFASSVLITDAVIKALEKCTPLAPLHNPPNLIGINAIKEVLGDVPQVGVFDTAFHQTMPPASYIYPIPYEYYEKHRVRRYGFHGTSHRYVSRRAAEMLGRPYEELRLISCHLGNGSSICAIKDGKSFDTSMGFTPIAGVPMGTRCGDIDIGMLPFIMKNENLDIDGMLNVLNKKSGVLGISKLSSDFRDLDNAASEGNELAALALEIFNNSVRKYIAAYAAAMGGVDAVIFTAGIGENSISTRENIITGLEFMGLSLDKEKNKVRGKETDVSADGSRARVLVIPTNEELVIALDTEEIVSALK